MGSVKRGNERERKSLVFRTEILLYSLSKRRDESNKNIKKMKYLT